MSSTLSIMLCLLSPFSSVLKDKPPCYNFCLLVFGKCFFNLFKLKLVLVKLGRKGIFSEGKGGVYRIDGKEGRWTHGENPLAGSPRGEPCPRIRSSLKASAAGMLCVSWTPLPHTSSLTCTAASPDTGLYSCSWQMISGWSLLLGTICFSLMSQTGAPNG